MLRALLFGPPPFGDREELPAFRFRFLIVVMLAAAGATLLLWIGSQYDVNPIDRRHQHAMLLFTTLSLLLWLCLRGQVQRFRLVAWSYQLLCLGEYTSCLLFVPQDELRIFWFVTNIPGIYLILGVRSGWWVSLFSLGEIWLLNPRLHPPYSITAMATLSVGMLYLAVFFHVFVRKAESYYHGMRAAQAQLAHTAAHDLLTGVLNAEAFYTTSDGLIAQAARDGAPFSVLFIDLDHFKTINDTFGHAAGDEVLKQTTGCIRALLRTSDVIGRVGGEEFSVLLPGTDAAGAQCIGEHIRAAIEALSLTVDDQHIGVTASIGVSSSHTYVSIKAIQQMADQAMYRSKAAGRNRVSQY